MLAEERLKDTHVRILLCGGNDDTGAEYTTLDETAQDRVVKTPRPMLVPIDDEHVVVTIGYSTPPRLG